ncbi:MAG: DUF6089 family protein [Bacteroidota bacterium]|nr:DUF6089 family protein [Bacteroidota bacterium]
MKRKLRLVIYSILIVFLFISQEGCEPTKRSQMNKGFGRSTYQVRTMGKRSRNVIVKAGGRAKRGKIANEIDMSFGLSFGSTNSLTDIGGTSFQRSPLFFDTQWSETHLSYGAFFRCMFSETFALNTTFNYSKLSGADSLNPKTTSRYYRGKYFEDNILEFGIRAEYFLPVRSDISFIKQGSELAYYTFLGTSLFYMDPNLGGKTDKIDLEETANKGLNPYRNFQFAIPMGLGIIFNLTDEIYLGLDIGWHKTFTDYLDGFTRPASKGNDSFITTNFNICYKIPTWRTNTKRSPKF